MRPNAAWIVLLAGLCATTAVRADPVEVRFIEPERFTDARDAALRRDDVLRILESDLKALGARHLPAGRTMQIDVLDVDLAGDAWPRFGLWDVRVLRGRVDWPRIQLRYTVKDGERVVASGTEQVADMAYLLSTPRGLDAGALPYERRMLERWFRERIAAPHPSAR